MSAFPTFATMALIGVWHGAGLTVRDLWLASWRLHRLEQCPAALATEGARSHDTDLLDEIDARPEYPSDLCRGTLALVFFRAHSLDSAGTFLAGMFGFHGLRLAQPIGAAAIVWLAALYLMIWGLPNVHQIMGAVAPALGKSQGGAVSRGSPGAKNCLGRWRRGCCWRSACSGSAEARSFFISNSSANILGSNVKTSGSRYLLCVALIATLALLSVWYYAKRQAIAFMELGYGVWKMPRRLLSLAASSDPTSFSAICKPIWAIIPRGLSASSTNLALAGGTPVESYFLLERILTCPTVPRRVVLAFGVSAFQEIEPFLWESAVRYRLFVSVFFKRFRKRLRGSTTRPTRASRRATEIPVSCAT